MPAKPKKKTASFGQFDMGRGTKAARNKRAASTDQRTLTGRRLTQKQKDNIAHANRKK